MTIRVPPRSPPRILIEPPTILHTNNDHPIDLVSGPNTQLVSHQSHQIHQEDPPLIKSQKKWSGPSPSTSIFHPRPSASFQTSSELFGRHRLFEKFNKVPVIPKRVIENNVSTISSEIRPSIPSLSTHLTTLRAQLPTLSRKWNQKPKNIFLKSEISSKDDIRSDQKVKETEMKNSGEFPVPSPIFREVTIPWSGISRKVSEPFEGNIKEKIIPPLTTDAFRIGTSGMINSVRF